MQLFSSRNLIAILFCLFALFKPLEAVVTPIWNPIPIHEAFVNKFTDVIPNSISPRQPPAPIIEKIPGKPSNETIWIPGYWAWIEETNDFAWVCGVWRRPPPSQMWIAGEWSNIQGTWTWLRGFWSSAPLEKQIYIDKAPPNSIDDDVPQAPGSNYFWVPGYWEYSSATKEYSWLSGKWEPFNQNWILAPASYIWRPNGYIFIPLYWDFPVEQRGNAYSCVDPGKTIPVIIQPEIIIRQLFICYPDYVLLYWHWWHFHPGWWDGCWCLPPWWSWSDWWVCPWGDLWGLWWWWGHPGFFPPWWITLELSIEIPPPSEEMLKFFKKLPKPIFPIRSGDAPLLPQGHINPRGFPRPHIPNDVAPSGQVDTPPLPNAPTPPGRQVTPPSPPSAPPQWQPQPQYPSTPSYPSQPQPTYPSYPKQPTYPPQSSYPTYPTYPDYPDYPARPQPPRYPPPSHTQPENPPSYNPPTYTPPTGRYPPTPPRTPPSHTQPYPPSYNPPTYTPPSRNPQTPPSNTQPRTPNTQPQYPNYNPPSYTPPRYTPPVNTPQYQIPSNVTPQFPRQGSSSQKK